MEQYANLPETGIVSLFFTGIMAMPKEKLGLAKTSDYKPTGKFLAVLNQ